MKVSTANAAGSHAQEEFIVSRRGY